LTDLTTVIGKPPLLSTQGENENISILCGLVAWAVEHPDQYTGWDVETLSAALRWNFGVNADEADEAARELAGDWSGIR
jgi:hypothetical protein